MNESTSAASLLSADKLIDAPDQLPEQSKIDPSLLAPLELLGASSVVDSSSSSSSSSLSSPSSSSSLGPFLEEYVKLQQALRKSHQSEERFINKCKSLSKQTRAHTHKVSALGALHAADTKKKKQLTEDIEAAKALHARMAQEVREKRAATVQVREELNALNAQLEENSNDFIRQQRNNISRLELEVNKFTIIRDKERAGLTRVRSKNIELFSSVQELLASVHRSQSERDAIDTKVIECKAIAAKEQRRKIDIEKRMKEVQAQVSERQNKLAEKKELIAKAERELAEVQMQLAKSEQIVDQHIQQFNDLTETARTLNEMFIAAQEENQAGAIALKKSAALYEDAKLSLKASKAQAEAKGKMWEHLKERVKIMTEETNKAEEAKQASVNEMKSLKESISAMQFKLNNNSKAMDTCVREREVLAQNHMSKVDAIKSKEAVLKIATSQLKNIKNEHQGYLVSIRALTKVLDDLKAEKSVHEADLNRRLLQKAKAEEEVSARELKITEYQKQISENENEWRKNQNLLEAVLSDRNRYRKELIEKKAEMHELRRKFAHLSATVKQLKTEIADKDKMIVSEHLNLKYVKEEINELTVANSATLASLSKADSVIKAQSQQVRKLTTIIADADEELRVQVKQYNSIVGEQRVLNGQLVKRNEELASLYEQLKLQTAVLEKSQSSYRERLSVHSALVQQRDALALTLEEVLEDIKKYDELKSTIASLNEALVNERLKVKALTDELAKPINIHRWRRLQDTNTDTYGMIKRVRQLQKSIIHKTASVEEKDNAIASKEKLYVELRRVLARQPGTEAVEQLRVYEAELKEKKRKLAIMLTELAMYQAKVQELKYDVDKNAQDMALMKLTYFAKRRKEQKTQMMYNSNNMNESKNDSNNDNNYSDYQNNDSSNNNYDNEHDNSNNDQSNYNNNNNNNNSSSSSSSSSNNDDGNNNENFNDDNNDNYNYNDDNNNDNNNSANNEANNNSGDVDGNYDETD